MNGTVMAAIEANGPRARLHFRNREISGDLLLHKAARLAQVLQGRGVRRGARVAVLLERSPDVLAVLLALWRLGALYIPLDPRLPAARLDLLAEDAAPGFLIARPGFKEKCGRGLCPRLELRPIAWQAAPASGGESRFEALSLSPGDGAYLLYTSGSSGKPKGVEIRHESLHALLTAVIPLLELHEGRVFLGMANFSFDIAFFELLVPLMLGATLVLLDEEQRGDATATAELIARFGADVIQATPSLWRLLLEVPWDDGKERLAISTGEALPRELAQRILARCSVLWNLYGPTETTIWASGKKLLRGLEESRDPAPAPSSALPFVPIGHALPGYRLFLDAEASGLSAQAGRATQLCWTVGELCIGGPGVATGYHGRPALSRRKFTCSDGEYVYRSGDLCRYGGDGELEFLGRLDAQCKVNGHRVEPQEVELALERHASVRAALVVPRPSAASNVDALLAYVVHEKGAPNKTGQNLNEYLAVSLPSWMLPARYLFVNALPLTPSGKKDRKALPLPPSSSHKEAEEPEWRTSREREIAGLFREILEVPAVGLHDSFFDLGGNSMLAATLLLAANQRFVATLSLKQLLRSPPTIAGLCRLLEEQETADAPGAR